MGNPALEALQFIVSTIFDIFALVVAVRFVMQAARVDYYNPIAQMVVKITDPALKPLRKIIPGFGGYDIAALVLCLLVIVVKQVFLNVLGFTNMGGITLLVASFLEVLNIMFNIFIFGLFVMALLSWIVQDPNNPLYELLRALTNPVLRIVRRFVPPMGGLDLSVMAAIIGLMAIKILVMGTLGSALL